MRRAREDEEFYRTAVALRRAGWWVYRVGPRHSRLNGRYLANAEVLRRAPVLLHQPVQLELFGWRNPMRAAAVEAVVVEAVR